MWPFSPSCIFVAKIFDTVIAESILFGGLCDWQFSTWLFLLNCIAQKGPAVCQQGLSITLNDKLCLSIYSNILFYIPQLPFSKLKKKSSLFFLALLRVFLGEQLKIIMGFLFFLKEKVNLHNTSFTDCQNIHEAST